MMYVCAFIVLTFLYAATACNQIKIPDINAGIEVHGLDALTTVGNEMHTLLQLPSLLIIGGENAKENEFPHQLSQQTYQRHRCGAVLLSDHYVLTAAHCIQEQSTLVFGTNSLHDNRITRSVNKTIPHSNWDPALLDSNFVLLYFSEPVEFTSAIKPVKLPQQDEEFHGMADATGWRKISLVPLFMPSFLQKTTLYLLDTETCRQIWNHFPIRTLFSA